ncbi:MAG: hypothetical protein U0521_25290 [Anaerolineae bacterium]
MSIKLEWLDQEKTLIYAKLEGRTEHEDFVAAEREFRAMVMSTPHVVDAIYDARSQVAFSPRMLETAFYLHRNPYPRLRFVVFVGKNLAWELFLTFVRQFGKMPYRFTSAGDLDEAHALIRRVRQEALLTPPPSTAHWN